MRTPVGEADYCEIKGYGLIGNCRTVALVSKRGSIDWACFPRFDSPSLFGALLDKDRGGYFSISPIEPYHSAQRYLEDSNLLATFFRSSSGTARLIDSFSVSSNPLHLREILPEHEIQRIVEGIQGELELEVKLVPRSRYGAHPVRLQIQKNWGVAHRDGHRLIVLQSDLHDSRFRIIDHHGTGAAIARFTVRAGQRIRFSFTYTEEAPAVVLPMDDSFWERLKTTDAFWKYWIHTCQYRGLYQKEVRRSLLALKLLTHGPTGSVLAAPTTSLPEEIGGVRNWDYRYCWLRDASFTIKSFVSMGFIDEAKGFMNWLLHTTYLTRPKLQVVYSVYGDSNLPERELDWLSGYQGSKPVRIGNNAHDQIQYDIYGEVMDGLNTLVPYLGELDQDTQKLVIGIGDLLAKEWEQPDEGIWEMRVGPDQHTHSKVYSWVAMDRLLRIANRFGWKISKQKYQHTAARLRFAIETRGFNKKLRAYTYRFNSEELDASVLTLPLIGYCHPKSKRFLDTLTAVEKTLVKNGLVTRYDPRIDGIAGREGAFGICSFWLAESLALAGKIDDAKKYFAAVLKHGSSQSLWSEEIDPVHGKFLGNFPQAFTHVGLINAARCLSDQTELHARRKLAA